MSATVELVGAGDHRNIASARTVLSRRLRSKAASKHGDIKRPVTQDLAQRPGYRRTSQDAERVTEIHGAPYHCNAHVAKAIVP